MAAWVIMVVAVTAVMGGAAASQAEETQRLVVHTSDGRISGFREHSSEGRPFYTFHSIPYAKPPVRHLRFKDPVVSEGWEGVRDGSKVPPVCSQIPYFKLIQKIPKYEGDEDCLYLSVFSPMPSGDKLLPVMVFIHGGAFLAGGSSLYNGNVMMNEDVILVLLQYRLGYFGFISTEDTVIPGNFGLKDQTLALRWVQKNIHHFRGDPARVTIFGESAGGASVHYHLISPHSRDLFARAIMMSGTLFSPWAMGGAYKQVARRTGRLFGCDEVKGVGEAASQALLQCLQGIDAKNLTLSIFDHVIFNYSPLLLGPRVDGDYIPSDPEVLMREGRHKVTDVISGVAAHEGGLFAAPLYSSERMKSDLVNNFDEFGPASLDLGVGDARPVQLAHTIFDHYVGGVRTDKKDADNICQLFGDRHFTLGHELVSQLFARNEASNTFMYSLDHRGQRSFVQFFDTDVGSYWISHVDDLFYLFTEGTTIWTPLEREEDIKLRHIMTKLWVNFASTGNPTPDDSLGFRWKSVRPNQLDYLSLTPTPTMKPDNRSQIRAFWETLPTRQNLLLHPDKVVPLPHYSQQASLPLSTRPSKWKLRDEL